MVNDLDVFLENELRSGNQPVTDLKSKSSRTNLPSTSKLQGYPEYDPSIHMSCTPLLCSVPESLSHSCRGEPTEVETILHKLGYPPNIVKLVAIYRITTREDLLLRLREEETKLKWELGMHKKSFENSGRPTSPRERSNHHRNMPASSFVQIMERSKRLWPNRTRPRRESVEEMVAQVARQWGEEGKDAESIEKELRDLFFGEQLHGTEIKITRPKLRRSLSDSATRRPSDTSRIRLQQNEGTSRVQQLDVGSLNTGARSDHSQRAEMSQSGDLSDLQNSLPPSPSPAPRKQMRTVKADTLELQQRGNNVSEDFLKQLNTDPCSLPGHRKRLPVALMAPHLRKATSMTVL